ncbi:MAG: NUDIX hydrolase [Candidatus Nomurabacteria bacterium]|nr:MAG: NUDIX hydrolase [Candidatus Nomurabacteria bacterium]
MSSIPECFYRVSVKALVLNETKNKFLVAKEENGNWELLGGGLDWGMSAQEDLKREIKEETGLKVTFVADTPSYFLTDRRESDGVRFANVLYETTLEDLNFTPSDECTELRFVDLEDCRKLDVFPSVLKLAEMFKTNHHKKSNTY